MPMYNTILCPKCNRNDMIQKVSGIQGNRFSLPDKPSSPEISCFEYILTISVLGIPFWIGLACALSGSGEAPAGWIVVAIVAALWGVRSWIYSVQKNQYEETLPIWQKAKSRLDELYYCAREDIVFDPSDGTSVPASRWQDYVSV